MDVLTKFNEVYMSDDNTKDENIVGELDKGWRVMIALMLHERTGIGAELFTLEKRFADLVDLAKNYKKNGQPVIKDPFVRQKMVSLYTRYRGSLLNYYRYLIHALINGY